MITFFSIMIVYLAIKLYLPNKKIIQPKSSINRDEFMASVKDGDLLATRACNNWMSRIHSFFLKSPVAHVGIALKSSKKVYLFEASAPRGAQIRDIDDYMKEGAETLWWRPLLIDDKKRSEIIQLVEKYWNHPYSWNFLKHLPKELFGAEAPFMIEDDEDSSSCGDLIAKIYKSVGIIQDSTKIWFPKKFLELQNDKFGLPINVIIEKNK